MYWLKTYQVPQGGRGSRGRPVINLLPLQKDEQISAILPVHDMQADSFIVMATSLGTIKKVALKEFEKQAGQWKNCDWF